MSIAKKDAFFLMISKGQLILKSTFCYPRILQKNKRNNFIMAMLGKKNEFVCSFFGRIVGLKKILCLCLTFRIKKKIMS